MTGFRAAAGLFNALLAVRLIGVENYGNVAVLLSLFMLYLSLNSSLFTVMVTRLMSPAVVEDVHARAQILLSVSVLTACSIAFLALATAAVFCMDPSGLGLSKFQAMDMAFLAMGGLVSMQILAALQAGIIEASGRLDLAMRAQMLGPFLLLLMLCIGYLQHFSLNALDYVLMLCVSASVDLGLLWAIRRHVLRLMVLRTGAHASTARLIELFRSGGVLQATTLMNLFLEPLNKFLLNHFVGPIAVTAYDLIMKVIWGIQGLFAAAMRVFLHIGQQHGQAVGRAYSKAIALAATPVLIAHTVGAILLYWVAHRWVNMDAEQLIIFFAIATLSNLGMLFVMPAYTSLISRGDMMFIFKSQAILALVNTTSSLLAIPFLGLLGAALGLLIATAYNAAAIYKRHGQLVGPFEGGKNISKRVVARFTITLLLFVLTLSMYFLGEPAVAWTITLLVCLLAIGATEPLTLRFFGNFCRTPWAERNARCPEGSD